MSTAVFLQARINSTRLPGKALLPLAGKSVILHAMEALQSVPAQDYVLLTDGESAPQLAVEAEKGGFSLFTGPREDVLRRYALAARDFGPKTIIRATGDNPLVSGEAARQLLEHHLRQGADYSTFSGLPVGTGVQCVDAAALLAADRAARERYDREHVCPYLHRHPQHFVLHHPPLPSEYAFPEGRVTLDTRADYQFLQRLYTELYAGEPIPLASLVAYLRRRGRAAG